MPNRMKASRDGHIIEGGPISLMKAIYGRGREDVEYILDYDRVEVASVMSEVLYSLTAREQAVIEMRFAINPTSPLTVPMTLAAIAKHGIPIPTLGASFASAYSSHVTSARIYQIEAKALRKLRHPTLRRYLDAHLVRRKEKDANRLGTTETSDD
jgi:hypothetical protein